MCWQQIGCMFRRSNRQDSCGETHCDVNESKLLEDMAVMRETKLSVPTE